MTHKSNGEHGYSGSGPGPELFLHRSCPRIRTSAAYPLGFLGRIREEGYALLFYPVVSPAFPSLIVAQSGGGDGFLFRLSKIPFFDVARRWSPFALALGSVALS